MSQDIFTSIDPSISGDDLATALNNFKDAMVSGMSGTSRPTELAPGGGWIDTTNDPTTWSYKVWTGVNDVEVFVIDLSTGVAAVGLAVDSFIISKVSADTVGAIMNLVKRRIATNGQVLSGDVVGEVRMIGRDSSGGDPVVAKIIYTATENQLSSAYGGTLSFYSTPQGTATLIEHMRFIGGVVETVVPHKTNAQILVGQDVATTATINQLSAAQVLVEFTGSTATAIRGLNSAHASKVVTLHNRSSAIVTLNNQHASATAADRLLLPEAKDISMLPQDSVTLYYCTADTRWKVQHASARFTGFTTDTVYGDAGSWVAPTAVSKARVTAHSRSNSFNKNLAGSNQGKVLDVGKNLFAWGYNGGGILGVGDVAHRSSPVLVLGGIKFVQTGSLQNPSANSNIGLSESGIAYCWGQNAFGQLGVGDVIPRSSPVAVLGGLKFKSVTINQAGFYALLADGTAYAWGYNAQGQLGVGDVIPRSSPVAVLGGLKFREVFASPGVDTRGFGLTFDGTAYAWGDNTQGVLGLGDLTPRSSPVAVLGGLKFKTLFPGFECVFGLTEAGVLYSWGQNTVGQLGLGDVVSRSSPVAVLGGLTFKLVNVDQVPGADALIAITGTGVAYAWGANARGQLGLGDVAARSSPVAVLGGLTFKKVVTCNLATHGLTEDGTLYGWGFNDYGQLGVGDVIPRSSPVAVLGGLSFQEISPDSGPRLGLATDGTLYAWGNNFLGQLGVGDIVDRSSPVAVLSGLNLKTQDDSTTVLDIPITGGNTYALKLGAGPCFFGSRPIGNNIQKVEITYVP